MTKPVWFLDIDGVINSFPNPPEDTFFEWETTIILGYVIHYAPEVISFINELHESGKVEVRWLTTWTDRANINFAPEVGIKHEFKVYDRHHEYGDYDWWKADHVRAFRQENPDAPFIWTDDDISYYLRGSRFEQTVGDSDYLVISPRTSEGLNLQALGEIREFAEQYA